MRRPLSTELMLLTTVVLWALNLTVTRYILTHGFAPLAYATVRYGAAAVIFLGIAIVAERSLRIRRSDLLLVVVAALCLWLNQLSFVYALEKSSASTIALILGATPIFADAWWYMVFPGVALLLTVLAFNLVGDAMQDALNPRAKKS